jgi:hypothetical protein
MLQAGIKVLSYPAKYYGQHQREEPGDINAIYPSSTSSAKERSMYYVMMREKV